MKFDNLKILICYLIAITIFLTDINICFKTNSKSKAHLKREPSLMETFNNFFTNKNTDINLFKQKEIPVQENQIYKPRFKNYNNDNDNDNENENKNINNNNESIDNNAENNFYKFKESKNSIKSSSKIKNKGLYDTYPAKPKLNNISKPKPKPASSGNVQLSNNQTSPDFWQNKLERKVKQTTKILQEGWFMISSPSFKSNFFPEIKINKNEVSKICIDQKNFRINNAFNKFSGKNKPPTDKYFWFRLSGLNFYYSVSLCDTNILGTISVERMNPPSEIAKENHGAGDIFCFTISDNSLQIWKICSKEELKIKIMICQINIVLGIKSSFCRRHKKRILPKNIAIQPMIIIPKPSKNCNEGWNYMKKGEDWECDCKEGREQSPIDLPSTEVAIDSPVTPLFHFSKVNSNLQSGSIDGILKENEGIKIKIWDNSLRILNPDMGRIITVDGAVFKAEEIVIHTPAEHTIQGKKYDAEMQVLFYGISKGDIAKQVVLSFLFEATPGEYNKFFESIDTFNFPNAFHNEKVLTHDIFIPEVFYNLDEENNINIKKFSFFTYQGSLTFPPCTENTIMYVASKPIPLSTTTLTLLKEAVRMPDKQVNNNRIYLSDVEIENDRKIQNTNGRPVFYYNHEKYCGPEVQKKKKEYGHYEKVRLTHENIFYVPDDKPSGIPEAFLIGKNEAFGKQLNEDS